MTAVFSHAKLTPKAFDKDRSTLNTKKDDIKMEFVISHLAKSYGKHQVLTDVDYTF